MQRNFRAPSPEDVGCSLQEGSASLLQHVAGRFRLPERIGEAHVASARVIRQPTDAYVFQYMALDGKGTSIREISHAECREGNEQSGISGIVDLDYIYAAAARD